MRSRRKKQGRKTLPGQELPDHLWSTIAGILGQKDWARVSGTCKTFHRIQLRVIEFQTNKLDELLWLSKRWRTAQALVIQPSSMERSSAAADVFVQMSAADALRPQSLRHLSVHDQTDCFTTGSGRLPQWVQQVLSNAHNLEVLVLNSVQPNLLVPASMAALKHLAFTATASAMPANWACIESLRCIETLHIAVPSLEHLKEYTTTTSAMHLQSCSSLRSLHVSNLLPDDLAVPADCRVTFQGILLFRIGSGSRQGIMAMLRSCSVCSIRLLIEVGPNVMSQLSILETALGQPLLNLEELDISSTSWGAANAPFEVHGAMPRLTRLGIRSEESPIHVVVRSPVYLRSLILQVHSDINFTPVHAASMFHDIEQVEMLWSGGQPQFIDTLVPLLQARSRETPIEWRIHNDYVDEYDDLSEEYGVRCKPVGDFKWLLDGGREVARWQVPSSDAPHGYSRVHCQSLLKCGACEGCLEQDGVLQLYR